MNKKLIKDIETNAQALGCMTSIANIKTKEDARFLYHMCSSLDTRFISFEFKVSLLKEIIKWL